MVFLTSASGGCSLTRVLGGDPPLGPAKSDDPDRR